MNEQFDEQAHETSARLGRRGLLRAAGIGAAAAGAMSLAGTGPALARGNRVDSGRGEGGPDN